MWETVGRRKLNKADIRTYVRLSASDTEQLLAEMARSRLSQVEWITCVVDFFLSLPEEARDAVYVGKDPSAAMAKPQPRRIVAIPAPPRSAAEAIEMARMALDYLEALERGDAQSAPHSRVPVVDADRPYPARKAARGGVSGQSRRRPAPGDAGGASAAPPADPAQ